MNEYGESVLNDDDANLDEIEQNFQNTRGIQVRISGRTKNFYRNFISKCQNNHMANITLQHKITDSEEICMNNNGKGPRIVPVYNSKNRKKLLRKAVKSLTKTQREAYKKAVNHLSGQNKEPLLMFISGAGGTGKTYLIKILKEYVRLRYGKQKGLYGAALAKVRLLAKCPPNTK